jgi:signal transduction histidine kinase
VRALHERLFDALLIAALLVLAEEEIWRSGVGGPARVAVPISTLGLLTLWWRRAQPLWSMLAVFVTLTVLLAGGIEILAVSLAVAIAVYSVAAYSATARASRTGGLIAGAGVAISFLAFPNANFGDLVVDGFSSGACWVTGEIVRRRKVQVTDLEGMAETLELRRQEDVRAAAEGERMRIARELHDVIAHNVSAIVLQAIGGRALLDSQPARAARPLQQIESMGRETLVEMRRLLGILRVGEEADARAPQPCLADLAAFVRTASESGVETELVTEGDLERVPRGLELSIVRIVQEALTNVRKHGGSGAHATVRVALEAEVVSVRVRDDGRGAPMSGSGAAGGHGLLGMRERVALYGGELRTRSLDPSGFEVEARFPLGAALLG